VSFVSGWNDTLDKGVIVGIGAPERDCCLSQGVLQGGFGDTDECLVALQEVVGVLECLKFSKDGEEAGRVLIGRGGGYGCGFGLFLLWLGLLHVVVWRGVGAGLPQGKANEGPGDEEDRGEQEFVLPGDHSERGEGSKDGDR